MDINTLRSVVTVISMLLFLALVGWTYARSRKSAFEEAAQLPFMEDGETPDGARQEGRAS
jgi:cytochrome c oxidase cbb3-type subunit IV